VGDGHAQINKAYFDETHKYFFITDRQLDRVIGTKEPPATDPKVQRLKSLRAKLKRVGKEATETLEFAIKKAERE
jgi:hypothetical protein